VEFGSAETVDAAAPQRIETIACKSRNFSSELQIVSVHRSSLAFISNLGEGAGVKGFIGYGCYLSRTRPAKNEKKLFTVLCS
jgi:hypothetical protein